MKYVIIIVVDCVHAFCAVKMTSLCRNSFAFWVYTVHEKNSENIIPIFINFLDLLLKLFPKYVIIIQGNIKIYMKGRNYMAFMLYDIEEAVDRKYVVTKSLPNQAKMGSVVHIMGTDKDNSSGKTDVKYRVSRTNQDFTASFADVKEFCKWIRPDDFVARYYEKLTEDDIGRYLKATGKTFVTFDLPILIVVLAIIWVISVALIKGVVGIIVGAVLSVAAFVAVTQFSKVYRSKAKLKLYNKVGTSWGISIK